MNAATRIPILVLALMSFPVSFSSAAEPVSLSFGGSLRYRYEVITLEKTDTRIRHRIRALAAVNAAVNPELSIGLQLASGNDVPFSRNQTLTGGFSAKPVFIDLAYFEYRPSMAEGFSVRGGKMRNPFHTPDHTELVWDNDLRPEGIFAGYTAGRGTVSVALNAAYFLIEERSAQKDAFLAGTQALVTLAPEAAEARFGAGYFEYRNEAGQPPFYAPSNSFGNAVLPDGSYRFGFRELDVFGEISPGALPGAVLFADYVTNLAGDVPDNTGWLAGASYGSLGAPGNWLVRYSYRRLEANAAVGVFTDDDFAGGGTDAEGHEIDLDYQLGTRTVAAATWYLNEKGLENGRGYQRLMLDIGFAF